VIASSIQYWPLRYCERMTADSAISATSPPATHAQAGTRSSLAERRDLRSANNRAIAPPPVLGAVTVAI